jgi:soluble lytic murein transglycosylase-like protein
MPPPPEPLEPLREFTDEEWSRIRRAQRFVHHAARKNELSPSLVNGMIWVESKFEHRARGRRGPRGMLQLMPRTARAMARRLGRKYMPYSIDFNVAAGTEYLVVMLEQFDDDLELALAAYNAGPAVVVAWQKAECPSPKPRQPYVAHVERAARAFCDRLPRRYEPDAGVFTCPPPPDEAPDTGLVASR